MDSSEIRLTSPTSSADWDDARAMCREYAASLGFALDFQGFDSELVSLPEVYGPPHGAFLLVSVDGSLAGCAGMRPLVHEQHPQACEMKRLFLRPRARGHGLGRLLALELMSRARAAGYRSMLLDTVDDMAAARGLYASLGFFEIAPYYPSPLPGTHYLKAALD